MHVLFLADGLFPFVVGGMQKHSTMLIKHLSPLVDQITVCTCGPTNAPPPPTEDMLAELVTTKSNVKVLACTFKDTGKLPGHYLRASRKLSQTYLNLAGDLSQYDCIYAQGLTGDAFLKKHPRVMVNLHGLNMFQPSFSWKESVEKYVMRPLFAKQIRLAWKVVSLGGKLTDILLANGARQERIVVLPNGVDDVWFDTTKPPRTASSTRFIMIGRNDPAKGFNVLQEALSILEEPIELHLVGDWPQIKSTHHNVTYHGVVRDKHELIKIMDACDVLVLPSLSEGMPTVVLEAKARGLEVIGTDVGAMSEIEDKLIEPYNIHQLMKSISVFNRTNFQRKKSDLLDGFMWNAIGKKTVEFLGSSKVS